MCTTHRVEHVLSNRDGDVDNHPVASGGALDVLLRQPMLSQPVVDGAETGVLGRDQRLDLLLREVLPVAPVRGVADRVHGLLQQMVIRLGETDAEADDMVLRRRRVLDPVRRGAHGLPNLVASAARRGRDGGSGEDEGEESAPGEAVHGRR